MELRRYEIILKTLLWHLNHFSSQAKKFLFYKAWEEKYCSQKSSSSQFLFFVIFSLTAIIFFKELILIIPNIIVSGHVKKLCDNSSLLCYFITNLSIQPPKINHALKFFESPDNPWRKQQKKKAAVKVCIIIECIKWFYYLRWQLLLWYENKKAKIAPYFISGFFSVYYRATSI